MYNIDENNLYFISLKDLLNKYSANSVILEKIKSNYLTLLSELTSAPQIEPDVFLENVNKIHEIGTIIVGIISNSTDENDFRIISSGTIIIEPKIIRNAKSVGHIEDIVVANDMRGKGISQTTLQLLKLFALGKNCYKVILDCDNEVKNVYIKSGFITKGVQMAEYF